MLIHKHMEKRLIVIKMPHHTFAGFFFGLSVDFINALHLLFVL